MSRVTKWKIEKTKVKVVFRLQFHATHIPQPGWDKLFISFIPADTGKATSKTTKANVRNGTCKWADPIYETTRLLQDIKTRQYEEKLYKLVVGMGSSRSSILGEANIDLADFVDALKPTAVALPLNGSEPGVTLHVAVQLLTSKTGFREFEQQRELREKGLQTTSDQGTHDGSADSKESSPDKNVNNHINKANSRVKLKRESKNLRRTSSLEGEAGLNEEYADSAAGFDGSSTTSESVYTEKHDICSTHEVDSLKSTISGDLGALSLGQSPQLEKGESPGNQFPPHDNAWAHGWSIDYSAANNLAAASEDCSSSSLKGSLEAVESSILDLKLKVSCLQNHSDEIGVETKLFSEQIVAEISSGEELAREVTVLKSECSKFKDEFEQLKSSKLNLSFARNEPTETDRDKLFQNLQFKWHKGLLLMEDKLRDIQKVSTGFPERDFRFFNLELERVVEILQDLKQESRDPISGTKVVNGRENEKMDLQMDGQLLTEIGSDAALFQPESMARYLTVPGIVSHEFDSVDPTLALKEKIFELLRELDESKTEREGFVRKMDQMECYYEALIQELEQSQRQMMAELQNLRNEHSTCLYAISAGKTEMEKMHQNMNEQIMKFSEDKRILESLNSEFERRAMSAEAALKRARLNYSIAVGQLQKDLELLSCQVLSMHETNENLINQTLSDSSLSNTDGFPEPVNYTKNSEGHASNQLLRQNHSSSFHKHLGEDILLSDLKRSLQYQEGLYKQVEEEICQMHFVNIYSDVFSKALQETLFEASLNIQAINNEHFQLSRQLELTNQSNDLLVLRLQNATNDILSLKEYKELCIAKSNDLTHQNQILEANLQNLAHENNLLTQKSNELEVLLTDYRSYKSQYGACSAENSELKSLLKKESLDNYQLHDEISILQEELKSFRAKFDELDSMKNDLQNKVIFLSSKLQELVVSYDDRHTEFSLCSSSACLDSECKDLEGLLLQLEEQQRNAFDRILVLIEEKKNLVNEKHMVQVSLNTAESDALVMRQKFECDFQQMVSKISVSGVQLQKLESDFEVFVDRISAGVKSEDIYSQQHNELFSSLDHLEAEIQQLNSKNHDLTQEIVKLGTLSSDVEMCKLTLATVTEEKKALELSLQDKTEESAQFSSEVNFLKNNLCSLHNQLHDENIFREKLEKTVIDLTTELNEKQHQLQDSDMIRQELVHLKQLVTDVEFEKSRISDLLHMVQVSLNTAESDALVMKQKYECDLQQMASKLSVSGIQLQKLELDFEAFVDRISAGLKSEEIHSQQHNESFSSLDHLEAELQQLNSRNHDLTQEIVKLGTLSGDLELCKLTLATITEEKKALELSLQDKAEESAQFSSEVNFLKNSLCSLQNQLHDEKIFREKLEKTVIDLTTELNEKQHQQQDSDMNRQELVHLKQLVTDVEFEKSRISDLLQISEKRLEDAIVDSSSLSGLETHLSEVHKFSIATDVVMTFTRAQFEGHVEELTEKLHSACRQVDVLCENNLEVESELNACLGRELNGLEENMTLSTSLDYVKSELAMYTAQCKALIDQNSVTISELKEHKSRTENVSNSSCLRESECRLEVVRLEQLLESV